MSGSLSVLAGADAVLRTGSRSQGYAQVVLDLPVAHGTDQGRVALLAATAAGPEATP